MNEILVHVVGRRNLGEARLGRIRAFIALAYFKPEFARLLISQFQVFTLQQQPYRLIQAEVGPNSVLLDLSPLVVPLRRSSGLISPVGVSGSSHTSHLAFRPTYRLLAHPAPP